MLHKSCLESRVLSLYEIRLCLKKNIYCWYYWCHKTEMWQLSALTFWSIWWKNNGHKKQREMPRATRKSPKMPKPSDLFVHGFIATRVSPQTLILVSAACAPWTPSGRTLRRSLFSHSLNFPANDLRGVCKIKTYLI